jgi:hypothetical protein
VAVPRLLDGAGWRPRLCLLRRRRHLLRHSLKGLTGFGYASLGTTAWRRLVGGLLWLCNLAKPSFDGPHGHREGSQLTVEVGEGVLEGLALPRHCDIPDVR